MVRLCGGAGAGVLVGPAGRGPSECREFWLIQAWDVDGCVMPANLTPEYKKAEELLRQATTTDEKIAALELMLAKIPKHKGTDHMQADLKRRLAKLREAPQGRAGARQGDVYHIPHGGSAGQVVLIGTPNSGKSALVGALTKAHVQVADFPFATHGPVPGILEYEDIQIQMVDMPPITREHAEAGQVNAYRHCDLILMVVDLSAADVTEQMDICVGFLRERTLMVPEGSAGRDAFYEQLARPVLCATSKSDLAGAGDFEALREMTGPDLEMVGYSIYDKGSLEALSRRIFERLCVVRVYSKVPGHEAEMASPFTLPAGATVLDLAERVHRELAQKLRFARAWGEGKHDAQQVPRDYLLRDKDIIELHFA